MPYVSLFCLLAHGSCHLSQQMLVTTSARDSKPVIIIVFLVSIHTQEINAALSYQQNKDYFSLGSLKILKSGTKFI